MDELYPRKNLDPWAVRTQLVMQLAALSPHDLQGDNLGEYKGVHSPFDHLSHVALVCGKLSDQLLSDCIKALRADPSATAQQAQARIDTWRNARTAGETPPLGELPGLAT